MRTIHGKTSVVSGIFHPLRIAGLLSTDDRYDSISFVKRGSIFIVCSFEKSHCTPPRCLMCLAMTRQASYMSSGGTRSPDLLSVSPMYTPDCDSVCDIARVPPCPRPMTVISDF